MSNHDRLAGDIHSEIADHLERRVRDLRESGMSESDALAQARAEFGDLEGATRELLTIDARIETRRRRARVWSGVGGDVRTAARRLAGQPGATALTILTLALAIGVAAAVFSVVDQLVLRAAPFLHADRLVDVWHLTGPNGGGGSQIRPEKTLGWQQQPALFERFEAYAGATLDLTESAEPERIQGLVVSLGLFDMLGIGTHIGRPFAEGDGAPGSEKVVILSHAFWRTRFGGSPAALGSQIVLNDERYTIVGVLPHGTRLMGDFESLWFPFDVKAWRGAPFMYGFHGIGRLNPAVDHAEAQSVADAIAARLGESTPLPGSWYLGLEQKRVADIGSSTRQVLFVLLGAVTLLLLIACVNVTSFSLGQAFRRARELQLRAAIGAGRWRLFREVLVETLMLAGVAGVAAAGFAYGALEVLLAAAPEGLAYKPTRPVEIDLRVLAVMTVATLTAGLLAGLLPGIRSSRVDLSSSLRDGTRGSEKGLSFGAGAGALVVVEIALATVLLVGTALMSRTLAAYHALDPGFDVDKLVTVQLALPTHRYPTEMSRRAFFEALDTALRRQPGIEASAYAWGIPPGAGLSVGLPQAEGRAAATDDVFWFINYVSPTYFETTGTSLLAGRAFNTADPHEHVILSETFAQMLWGNEPAVGKRFRQSPGDSLMTVVGVARDVEARASRNERSALQMYTPMALPREDKPGPPPASQTGRSYASRMLIVRATQPSAVPAAVREQVRLLDPLQPVGKFTSGTEIYAEPFAQQQFLLTVMGTLAGIALLLAAMGIFGVLSQAVTRRRREIGIRVALGSGHARLIRMLVGRGLALAAAGAAAGAAGALAGVKTLESLLFGVSPFDVVSFASVVLLLMAVALLACWWPTRRALAVEPAEVLRSE